MKQYLNTGIKEIITKFPRVADILNEYNIGCVPCNAGTCFLKDIVEIHNLSLEDEQELMKRIAKVIYPGKEVEIPKIKRKPPANAGEIKYSPPIKRLVDEHILIKRLIAIIPQIIEVFDKKLILDCVDFIRSYADKYHHAKEEDILFKYFAADLDIVKTMLIDHETGRNYVKAILEGLNKRDKNMVAENLNAYKDLLTEHIKKEDEILYPWMDRNFSLSQIGELFEKFNKAEELIDKVAVERCRRFIEGLEEKIKKNCNHKIAKTAKAQKI